jgi:hypothetical protein
MNLGERQPMQSEGEKYSFKQNKNDDAVSNLLALLNIIGRILLKYIIDFLVTGGEILILIFIIFTILILQCALVPDLDHTTSFFGLYDGHTGLILIAIILY